MKEKLITIIPKSCSYQLEKLYQPYTQGSNQVNNNIARDNAESLINVVEKVKNGVEDRYGSIDSVISFSTDYKEIKYALNHIYNICSGDIKNTIELKVYADFCRAKINSIVTFLKNSDQAF